MTRRRTRLSEVLPPSGFSDAGLVGELGTIADVRAQLAAYEAVVVAELARRRPVEWDLTDQQPGHGVEGWRPVRVPVGVSEFLADELAVVAGISRTAATLLAERSLVWVHELPETWAALADSLIDPPRATAIAKALGGQSQAAGGRVEPAVVAEVEAQALGWAVAGETPVRLQERTAAALIALDDAAADRRRKKAEQCADVTTRATADGMGQLVADLPMPVAAACRETVDGYARMAKAEGDERPIGQLRTQVMADLILRPWDTSREPVTAHLTVLTPLPALHPHPFDGSTPPGEGHGTPEGGHRAPDENHGPGEGLHASGEGHESGEDLLAPGGGHAAGAGGLPACDDRDAATVDGAPITAGQLRELLAQLDAICPGGLQAPTGGTLGIDLTDPDTGALRATVTRPELERLARRGCPAHPDRDCGCGVLDRPPPIDRYTPTPAQQRYVRARDRTCRHPGCRRPAARTDLDHVCAHRDGGATDCTNLCCLCRRHHRLKTHAPRWRFVMTDDGALSVTTPSGVTRTTRPPGLHLPSHRTPSSRTQSSRTPGRQPPGLRLSATGQLTGGGSPPDPDDPPPF
ncbi:HNH endonuclease signature motif containing protein [Modestobacter sp. VKM Ac-2983]|uniref:HNH endonuclease signature motif containing protein n=1 Tax=Modestobacter sp. VKM Ac-2983 TaxID=3004137 RepID=UPI0022ABB965|nr:HNH endonuclease signature motif containing protein [Modestobacter sp. VKM Ac-2983]MCZ2805287.1 HNH endonuclease signature motif containing protein [Modestobacter sp. VKM Ac-2983]